MYSINSGKVFFKETLVQHFRNECQSFVLVSFPSQEVFANKMTNACSFTFYERDKRGWWGRNPS